MNTPGLGIRLLDVGYPPELSRDYFPLVPLCFNNRVRLLRTPPSSRQPETKDNGSLERLKPGPAFLGPVPQQPCATCERQMPLECRSSRTRKVNANQHAHFGGVPILQSLALDVAGSFSGGSKNRVRDACKWLGHNSGCQRRQTNLNHDPKTGILF